MAETEATKMSTGKALVATLVTTAAFVVVAYVLEAITGG